MTFKVPEKFRLTTGPMRSDKTYGNNGMFLVRTLKFKREFKVVASDGAGWEHVSVSLHDRTPTWEEMNFIKGLFWDEEDLVMQLHPPKSDYINNHKYCLHLWRPINQAIPTPDSLLVGVAQ